MKGGKLKREREREREILLSLFPPSGRCSRWWAISFEWEKERERERTHPKSPLQGKAKWINRLKLRLPCLERPSDLKIQKWAAAVATLVQINLPNQPASSLSLTFSILNCITYSSNGSSLTEPQILSLVQAVFTIRSQYVCVCLFVCVCVWAITEWKWERSEFNSHLLLIRARPPVFSLNLAFTWSLLYTGRKKEKREGDKKKKKERKCKLDHLWVTRQNLGCLAESIACKRFKPSLSSFFA